MNRLTAVCLLLVFASCISTKAVLLDPSAPVRPEVDPKTVRIITEEHELNGLRYTRIAMIESTGNSEFSNQSRMIESMRKKAGKLGANAIIMPTIDEPGAGAKVAGAIFGVGAERKGKAIAIFIRK